MSSWASSARPAQSTSQFASPLKGDFFLNVPRFLDLQNPSGNSSAILFSASCADQDPRGQNYLLKFAKLFPQTGPKNILHNVYWLFNSNINFMSESNSEICVFCSFSNTTKKSKTTTGILLLAFHCRQSTFAPKQGETSDQRLQRCMFSISFCTKQSK